MAHSIANYDRLAIFDLKKYAIVQNQHKNEAKPTTNDDAAICIEISFGGPSAQMKISTRPAVRNKQARNIRNVTAPNIPLEQYIACEVTCAGGGDWRQVSKLATLVKNLLPGLGDPEGTPPPSFDPNLGSKTKKRGIDIPRCCFVCRGWGSNPRPQLYECCALTD